jgi:tRNA(Arg) A34 adenosine deaminase TadA
MNNDEMLMREALQLARRGMQTGGGPFGAVVARDGVIVASGMNESRPRNDPTAHAEMMAIRAAGEVLGRRNMGDCALYSSCEPCPMCLAASYWAQIPLVIYSCTSADADAVGFPDMAILAELRHEPAERRIRVLGTVLRDEGLLVFEEWTSLLTSGLRRD